MKETGVRYTEVDIFVVFSIEMSREQIFKHGKEIFVEKIGFNNPHCLFVCYVAIVCGQTVARELHMWLFSFFVLYTLRNRKYVWILLIFV